MHFLIGPPWNFDLLFVLILQFSSILPKTFTSDRIYMQILQGYRFEVYYLKTTNRDDPWRKSLKLEAKDL